MSHPPYSMSLLSTKLHPPPGREEWVVRPLLLDKLDASLKKQKITLVCAPAGYGKTTLLCQWASRRTEPIGWVSLDRSDNDLAQFLRYFLAALQHIEPNIGALTLEMLQSRRPLPGPVVWMPLINAVAAFEKEFIVILDDYQEVEEDAVHEALAYLIEHMPDNMHLVLATRADPPLPLPRLRARWQLFELRLSDLRFSTEETAQFLNKVMNLGLSAGEIAALETRTEGWIASLQMVALSLQSHGEDQISRSGHIQAFTGSHRFILDYLVEEVLEQQSPGLQDFLLKTSILDRLCGSLCDALVEEMQVEDLQQSEKSHRAGFPYANSQSILERLESANLFIVPLDDNRLWYRYHRLFSDLLRKRLGHMYPGFVPRLHLRASLWYEQQRYNGEAIHHALEAESYERAAALLEDIVEATLMRSEVKTFLNWMDRLPGETVRTHPRLAFFHAWALMVSGQSLDVVERRLQSLTSDQNAAESTGVQVGRMAALRAYLLLFQVDIQQAAELCRQALDNLPEDELFLRSIVTWIMSMIRLSDGELQDGKVALDKIAMMSQEIGNPLIAVAALSQKSRIQMRQGRLQLAHETLEQALQLATDAQGRRLPIASEALIGLGELEREWNHLEKAAEYLNESIELAKQWNEQSSFDVYFPLMRLRLAQGNSDAAREALDRAWQIAHGSDISQVDDILVEFHQAYFFAKQGNVGEFMRWAEKRGLVTGVVTDQRLAHDRQLEYIEAHLRKYEQLVLARAFIFQGKVSEALELLESLAAQARQSERIDLIIENQILTALAYQAAGQATQAMDALSQALSYAEPGGYVRIFLDEGESMLRLLRQAARRGLAPAYVSKLLAASGVTAPVESPAKPSHAGALIEPLSERELHVLRLLATGMSNLEIAGELVVAVSTVHSHCKSIYGKLGVHTRWDAVQRARELELI